MNNTVQVVLVATREGGPQIEGIFSNSGAAGNAMVKLFNGDHYEVIFALDELPEWAPTEASYAKTTDIDECEVFLTASGKLIWAAEMPIQD